MLKSFRSDDPDTSQEHIQMCCSAVLDFHSSLLELKENTFKSLRTDAVGGWTEIVICCSLLSTLLCVWFDSFACQIWYITKEWSAYSRPICKCKSLPYTIRCASIVATKGNVSWDVWVKVDEGIHWNLLCSSEGVVTDDVRQGDGRQIRFSVRLHGMHLWFTYILCTC